MDLIYTNAKRIDQGVLKQHALDLSFGAEENDFELTLGAGDPVLETKSVVYMEGTEYGGMVGGRKSGTTTDTITYYGRTWHGILNSKVIKPDAGAAYFVVSGDLNAVLGVLIKRMGLSDLFTAEAAEAGISVASYQFTRYCKGYDGIRALMASAGAKLMMAWEGRSVRLYAVPIVDYSDVPVDDDEAVLTVEQHDDKVNHLVCLGQGELADRTVVDLYVDRFGRIGSTQYYKGLDEIEDVYDNSNAESAAELRTEGIERLKALRDNDKAEISAGDSLERVYDIGDIVGAKDLHSGISASATVTQKIVKISNGAVTIEYKIGS